MCQIDPAVESHLSLLGLPCDPTQSRSNSVGSLRHFTNTQRSRNNSLLDSQQQNYNLEYFKLFSRILLKLY